MLHLPPLSIDPVAPGEAASARAEVEDDAMQGDWRNADKAEPSVKPSDTRLSRGATVLALQARALTHASFDDAAADVVNQLASLLACERVSLGLVVGSAAQVKSISGLGPVTSKHGDVVQIAAAMSEALDQRSTVVYPLPVGSTPTVTAAHKTLAQAGGSTSLLTVIFGTRHETQGVLLFERRDRFARAIFEGAKDAAMFVGPLLALKHQSEQGFARHLSGVLRAQPGPFRTVGRGRAVAAAVATVLVLASGLAFVPVTHRVVTHGRVEGEVQQVMSAPVDGFIATVAVRPGAAVKAGEVLMSLDTRELAIERDKWAAEMAQLDKQYREAMSGEEAAPIVIARSKFESARAQHDLAERQIERAVIRAPLDGIVLSGDWSQAVGAPLRRGQELMTLAPLTGWRIVADVREDDIAQVQAGQTAHAVFAALRGDERIEFPVTRIAPVATQVDGANIFEVEGTLASAPAGLRPGMRGVVRIEAGRQAWASRVWTRVRAWMRRTAWQLIG